MQHIYLDNNTITKPCAKVVQSMHSCFEECWLLPSTPHAIDGKLLSDLERAYRSIYSALGASNDDGFIFTASGSEAVNHIISSIYRDSTIKTGKNQFVTSGIDEAPAIMAVAAHEAMGCLSSMAEVESGGYVTVDTISDAITPRTALVSLSWANALTGVINPIEDIAELCSQRGIPFHLEASHVFGKVFFEARDITADYITFEGSLIHAPQGTGGLYYRQGASILPFIHGGDEQNHLRGAPHNTAALIALGNAAEKANENLDFLATETARLRGKFESALEHNVPGACVLFKESPRIPTTTAISFPGASSEALLFRLHRKGVFASIGGSRYQTIGNTLAACGIENALLQSALSFSLSRNTTEREIDTAIEIITEEVLSLQKLSEGILI